jgi:O-antigen ligase
MVGLLFGTINRDSNLGLFLVGGIAAAGLAGLVFLFPQFGTYVLAVTIFTNISSILSDQGLPGINKPLVALTFVAVMAGYFLAGRRIMRLKGVEWFLWALGGVWLASYFVAYDRSASAEQIVEFGKNFVILLVVVYSLNSQASWKQVIWFIILSTTFLATLGVYQVITGNYDQEFWQLAVVTPDVTQMRLSGSVGDPNFHGQILAAVLPLTIYRILDDKNPLLRLVAVGAAFLLVFAILNTYSRGAFLAMVVTLTLIAIERRIRFSLVILILITAVVMMQFLPEGYTQRLETLYIFTSDETTVHSEGSFRGRTSEMLSAQAMFTEHPLLGVGAGNYEANYQDYASRLGLEQRTEDRQAHSLYLEIAAETGMLGILAFTGLFAALMIGFSRARRKARQINKDSDWPIWVMSLQMAITSYLVSSIFLHGDFIRFLFFLVALGIAAIHLSDRMVESRHPRLSKTRLSNS